LVFRGDFLEGGEERGETNPQIALSLLAGRGKVDDLLGKKGKIDAF
jgi:hypothetical protein